MSKLFPYITVLPSRTTVNINTAPVEVIFASVPGIEIADAKSAVTARERAHFTSNADAIKSVPVFKDKLKDAQHGINTQFFEVVGRLRLEQTMVEERSLVDRRDTNRVKTLWRERSVVAAPETNANTSTQP